MEITYEQAHEYFEYRDGNLFWKKDVGYRVKKGKIAGCISVTKHKKQAWAKYWRVVFNGKSYGNHNIIFLMHHGYLPTLPDCVDHIDNNSLNNNILNLRHATRSQNAINQKIRIDNTYGIKGVIWQKLRNNWMARIHVNCKHIYLGRYKNFFDACCARKSAENKYHGEFSFKGVKND